MHVSRGSPGHAHVQLAAEAAQTLPPSLVKHCVCWVCVFCVADPWSRYLSRDLGLETHLFDCFRKAVDYPFVEEAANYKVPYKRFDICIGPSNYQAFEDQAMRVYKQLDVEKYPKLSVMLKLDVEGSEWPVLEALTDKQISKVLWSFPVL